MSQEPRRASTTGYAISYNQWVLGSWRFHIIPLADIPRNTEGRATLPKGEFCTLIKEGYPLPDDADTLLPREMVEINGNFILPDTSISLKQADNTSS